MNSGFPFSAYVRTAKDFWSLVFGRFQEPKVSVKSGRTSQIRLVIIIGKRQFLHKQFHLFNSIYPYHRDGVRRERRKKIDLWAFICRYHSKCNENVLVFRVKLEASIGNSLTVGLAEVVRRWLRRKLRNGQNTKKFGPRETSEKMEWSDSKRRTFCSWLEQF